MIKSLFFATILISVFSCSSSHCESKIECETQVVLKIEGKNEGQYVVEKRLTRDRQAIDTLSLDESGELKFGLDVEKIEIYSIRNLNKQSEIIFIVNKGDQITINAKSDNIGGSFSLKGTKENESLNGFIGHERLFQA
ncbi:MAG: hypothetical protein ACJA0Q_001844, partial [Saprospiraceae bacterium]